PITNTLAGGTVPAAVISMGKKRGRLAAARSTALYPDTVLILDSTSMLCARDILGMESMLNKVIPCLDISAISSRATKGWYIPTRIFPDANVFHSFSSIGEI